MLTRDGVPNTADSKATQAELMAEASPLDLVAVRRSSHTLSDPKDDAVSSSVRAGAYERKSRPVNLSDSRKVFTQELDPGLRDMVARQI